MIETEVMSAPNVAEVVDVRVQGVRQQEADGNLFHLDDLRLSLTVVFVREKTATGGHWYQIAWRDSIRI